MRMRLVGVSLPCFPPHLLSLSSSTPVSHHPFPPTHPHWHSYGTFSTCMYGVRTEYTGTAREAADCGDKEREGEGGAKVETAPFNHGQRRAMCRVARPVSLRAARSLAQPPGLGKRTTGGRSSSPPRSFLFCCESFLRCPSSCLLAHRRRGTGASLAVCMHAARPGKDESLSLSAV
ncbi:hypothetical protein GGR56DRAFT_64913 [Xylariaceae sp. FL0804]|nr:hypothetical protein GGR56DRAFT_64913 [Xylariaceae sp. FL0804]